MKDIVTESAIQTARFSFTGAVSKYTIGTYDPGQQVYVTFSNTSFREVTECCGNISLNEGKPHVFGSIVLCDQQGAVEGGRLFSETIVYAGEIIIEELLGPPLKRLYDPDTGLVL